MTSETLPLPDTSAPAAELEPIRARYLAFAENEARRVSPLYDELAMGVAGSEPLLRFIATLPEAKQQPNLVLAAVRHCCGTPADTRELAAMVERHGDAIRRVALARSTQTNEPGRCAALLPALGLLPGPLALLEVGASAGLCLLPDRYGYDYDRMRIAPADGRAPVFPCIACDATPLPARVPRIAWRAGIDLNPIDLDDPEAAAWLETLVWPGNPPRAERLRAAIQVAREHRPTVVRGDLLQALPTLAAAAPADATLVIFHSAVLAYVSPEVRDRFARLVAELGARWISNEFPRVLPWVAARCASPPPDDRFLLAMDGVPLALTGPHGQSIEWLA